MTSHGVLDICPIFSQAHRSRQCVQCGRWCFRCIRSGIASFHKPPWTTTVAVRDGKLWSRPSRESPDLSKKVPSDPLNPKPKTVLGLPCRCANLPSSLKVRAAKGDPKDAGFAHCLCILPFTLTFSLSHFLAYPHKHIRGEAGAGCKMRGAHRDL